MHLVHSPLCVPEGYIERFDFIRDADDNINHDRQCKPSRPLSLRSLLTRLKEMCVRADVAAMVNYLDDVVGNVATALKDAGLWDNTLMVWSSGAADRLPIPIVPEGLCFASSVALTRMLFQPHTSTRAANAADADTVFGWLCVWQTMAGRWS